MPRGLARFAALCQESGLVPVVEPEVLMEGDHSIGRCAAVTAAVLRRLFNQLVAYRVNLGALLLKVNMVPPALHNANLSTELPGDVLSVVGVHAKVRRDGYRR